MAKIQLMVSVILLLSLGLVACDNGGEDKGDNDSNDTSATATVAPDNGNDENGDAANGGITGQQVTPTEVPPLFPPDGEMVRVVRVIDGDTIDIAWHDEELRVRYIGVNTPERNEPCYNEATEANRNLVEGQIIRLFSDTSETDQFDRMLRYVFLGNTHVNALLVEIGVAEAVYYPPDTQDYEIFLELEQQAAAEGVGCHPTGIFDDGTYER